MCSNTYSGGTTISSPATLFLGQAVATLGSGNLTVTPDALLDVTAYGAGYKFTGATLTAGRLSAPNTDINGSLNMGSNV